MKPTEIKENEKHSPFKNEIDEMLSLAANAVVMFEYAFAVCRDSNLTDEEKEKEKNALIAETIKISERAKELATIIKNKTENE